MYSVVILHVLVDEYNSTLKYTKLWPFSFLPTYKFLPRSYYPYTHVRNTAWGREEEDFQILDHIKSIRKKVIKPTLVASMMILLIFSLSKPCIPALLSLRPILSRSPSLQELSETVFMSSIVFLENKYLFYNLISEKK